MATINFLVEIPVANPFKFILDGANSDERANFDQRRYSNVKNASVEPLGDFKQPVEKNDPVPYRVQFYSNFPLNRLKIVDCDDNEYGAPMIPSVAIQYRNKKYRSACKLSSIDDKLFIYFMEGLEYSDADFLVPADLVALNGVTPNINAIAGDLVRFSINGGVDFINTTIDEIRWNPELQAEGYLTDLDYTLLNPIDGLVEITYNEKPANLLVQLLDFSALADGEYFIRYEVGIADYTISFTTEPIDVQEKHADTLALEYRHVGTFDKPDIWNYIYLSDWWNVIRIPTDFYKFIPAGEVEIDINDSAEPRMLRARPFRQLSISFIDMPGWLADKIQVALSHDTKVVNKYEWELADNYGSFDLIDLLDQGTYEVNLRQKNDRTKKVNPFAIDITASWTPSSFEDLPFGGTVVSAVFNSNSLGVFFFEDLPDWITPNAATFQNGDEVDFTIAENETLFEKLIELVAICEEFLGVEAPISFHQLYDTSTPPPPEFIEASDTTLDLGYATGSSQTISVSASSDYSVTPMGPDTFTITLPNSALNLKAEAPTENNGSANRTATVRLALLSNPAIFVDLLITQVFRPDEILSLTPPGAVVGELPDAITVDVETLPATQWQADSPETWINHSTAIHVGSTLGFEIFVSKKPVYITERTGSVTFFNILNPSDSLSFIITQVDGE